MGCHLKCRGRRLRYDRRCKEGEHSNAAASILHEQCPSSVNRAVVDGWIHEAVQPAKQRDGKSMMIVSDLVNLASKIGGPHFAFQVKLRRLQRWRNFEREFYMLDQFVDPGRAAIDIGANHGFYAGRLAQLTKRVHCFEPVPALIDELRQKLDHRVIVHGCALSDHAGTTELRIPYRDDDEWHGDATIEQTNHLYGDRFTSVDCKVARLDDLVNEPVGFIKIDVEGHEVSVLRGAQRILTKHHPILLVESERRHNKEAPENIFSFLAGLGYSGYFHSSTNEKIDCSSFSVEEHQQMSNFGTSRYVCNFLFRF